MIMPVTEKLGHTLNVIVNHAGLAHACFELGEKEKASEHLAQARSLAPAGSCWFAVMLCNRCRNLLRAHLGIAPSPETETVYSSVLQ